MADVLRFFKIDIRIIGDAHVSKQCTGRKYWEEKGLPVLTNLQYKISSKESKLKSTIFLAVDQLLNGSLNAAMIALERAAMCIIQTLEDALIAEELTSECSL